MYINMRLRAKKGGSIDAYRVHRADGNRSGRGWDKPRRAGGISQRSRMR